MPFRVLVAVLLVGCAARSPRVAVGPLADGLDGFLAGHRLSAGENVRADPVARTATASYHLVQVRHGEMPHRHRTHDLTVVMLRGGGVVRIGARRFRVVAGDAVLVPSGVVHWFTNGGNEPAVTLAVFTPPLDEADNEPASDVD